MENKSVQPHNVSISDRKSIALSGVSDVMNFDEGQVTLSTSLGVLMIEGAGMHMQKMNISSGEMVIDGEINGVMYIDTNARKPGLFSRRR